MSYYCHIKFYCRPCDGWGCGFKPPAGDNQDCPYRDEDNACINRAAQKDAIRYKATVWGIDARSEEFE